jgi:hypothetical protein
MAVAGTLGGELHLVARHGHTVGAFTVTWTDASGAAVNYTGATFETVIKPTWDDASVDTFDIVQTSPTGGIFTFELPFARCAALQEGAKYVYLISVVMAGKKIPLLQGTLELRGS